MTKDYFKRVVATDIITKAMQVATARDELTQGESMKTLKKILDYIFIAVSVYFIICVMCAG